MKVTKLKYKIYIKIPHGEIQYGRQLKSLGFWYKGKWHWIRRGNMRKFLEG